VIFWYAENAMNPNRLVTTNNSSPARPPALAMQIALRLEYLTIGWMIIEAAVSLGAGVVASSLLLLAFGADSIIELISAGVLLHRLRKEAAASPDDMPEIENLEKRASRIAGILLFVLAAYVVLQSGYGLLHHAAAKVSWIGMAVAFVAAFGMPVLARAKIRAADQIGSQALRADAMESFTCGYLSWALLAGLVANALLHWWWLDSVCALVLVPFLIKEGREALTGECGCCASHRPD
jgi:divalent metal cation (Fe/Co/Zn/Cd) transporter